MNLFFIPDTIESSVYVLPELESRHCVKVLRLKTGSKIFLTNGQGILYEGIIKEDNVKECLVEIVSSSDLTPAFPYYLHLAVAPPKNLERYEWFVEKATEIGVSEITSMITKYSEREKIKPDRIHRILISAMKQSLQYHLPTHNQNVSFNSLVESQGKEMQKFIAYCEKEEASVLLQDVYQKENDVLILIGPEGDFSTEEVMLAKKHGFIPVSLGETRLRTETAALVACSTVHFVNKK